MPKSAMQKVMSERLKTNVMELVNSGKNMTETAKVVGVSVGRVSQIVTEKRLEWTARREIAIQDHIEVEIAMVKMLRQEALGAWERSKEDGVTTTTVKVPRKEEKNKQLRSRLKKADDKLRIVRQEEKRVGQVGDIACLHVAETLTDKLLKLLNAYPKEDRTEVLNIMQINWGDLAKPIPSQEVIDVTPSSEIEARIASELGNATTKNNSSNGNGHA